MGGPSDTSRTLAQFGPTTATSPRAPDPCAIARQRQPSYISLVAVRITPVSLANAITMKLSTVLSGLALAGLTSAAERTAAVYIQPVLASAPAPILLAEITYDPYLPAEATVSSFEFPELESLLDAKNLRIGVYSPSAKSWESSTSIASVQNFGKGYSPHIILNVDQTGDVVGAALKGVRIDAGQTRDFGPKAVVRVTQKGEQVALNAPVKLSPEGKAKVEEQPKTLLQKYWWLIGIVVLLTLTGGGGDGK
ncbi:cyclin-dependent protein kinase regulator pho80 [Seiridium cupressi]